MEIWIGIFFRPPGRPGMKGVLPAFTFTFVVIAFIATNTADLSTLLIETSHPRTLAIQTLVFFVENTLVVNTVLSLWGGMVSSEWVP